MLPWSVPALSISFILNFDDIFVCLFMRVDAATSEGQRTTWSLNSLLSPCGILGSNSGYQAGLQAR